jgi:hypothetical protein
MTGPAPDSSPFPSATDFVNGKERIFPLRHDSKSLVRLVAELDQVAVTPESADRIVKLGEQMKRGEWAVAHEAARSAVSDARVLMTDSTHPLAAYSSLLDDLLNGGKLDDDRKRLLENEPSFDALKPLRVYLDKYGDIISLWSELLPATMKPREGETSVTPMKHRKDAPGGSAKKRGMSLNVIPPKPATGGSEAKHDHVHTDACKHDHGGHSHDTGDKAHTHGPDCDHSHDGHDHSPKKSGGNAASVALLAGAAGLSAIVGYMFGRDRKDEMEATERPDPVAHEKTKTKAQRAEDIAYTINHSIACTVTDFINPVVNTFTEGKIKGVGGCGHDHSKDGGHGHGSHSHSPAPGAKWWDRVKHSVRTSFSKDRLVSWAKGEFIGDFGAVPLTIAMQRWLPGTMDRIRRFIEPVMGPLFRYGIERDSKQWANQNNVKVGSDEFKAHKRDVYEHEMSHLPQAVMWTTFSLGLNVAYQKYKDATRPITNLLISAMSGMAVTAALVVGARAVAPRKVRQFDKVTSETLFLPATKVVGKLFGVDSETVERVVKQEERLKEDGWVKKTEASATPSTQVIR